MNSPATNQSPEMINKLLRGEISAIETYDQVIAKFEGKSQQATLASIRHEHVATKKRLKSLASRHGEEPETSSGIWGSWAKFTTGTAKLFGEEAALKALKEGEEHGLNEYHAAIEENDIDPMVKSEIEAKLIPAQKQHIEILNKLISLQ